VPDPKPRRQYHGGLFNELPEKTGLDRHHLLSRDSLEIVGQRLGITLKADFGPAILIDPADHQALLSSGVETRHRNYRAKTTRLLLAGSWDEALEREIAEIERVAPGKYTDAVNEAREYGKALWPDRRHDQLRLYLDMKRQKDWRPTDPLPGTRLRGRLDPRIAEAWRRDSEERQKDSEQWPKRRPDPDRGIGD
jgi:hypothetical protein